MADPFLLFLRHDLFFLMFAFGLCIIQMLTKRLKTSTMVMIPTEDKPFMSKFAVTQAQWRDNQHEKCMQGHIMEHPHLSWCFWQHKKSNPMVDVPENQPMLTFGQHEDGGEAYGHPSDARQKTARMLDERRHVQMYGGVCMQGVWKLLKRVPCVHSSHSSGKECNNRGSRNMEAPQRNFMWHTGRDRESERFTGTSSCPAQRPSQPVGGQTRW